MCADVSCHATGNFGQGKSTAPSACRVLFFTYGDDELNSASPSTSSVAVTVTVCPLLVVATVVELLAPMVNDDPRSRMYAPVTVCVPVFTENTVMPPGPTNRPPALKNREELRVELWSSTPELSSTMTARMSLPSLATRINVLPLLLFASAIAGATATANSATSNVLIISTLRKRTP